MKGYLGLAVTLFSFALPVVVGAQETTLTLSLEATPLALPSSGPVTYTLSVSNAGVDDALVDDFVCILPTDPASPTYTSSSSTFDGSTTSEPNISDQLLVWNGIFVIPSNSTKSLKFQADFPATSGEYTASGLAHSGSIQIDSTSDTSDNSPPQVTVVVEITPTPTPTPEPTPSPTPEPTPSPTPTPGPTPEPTPTSEPTPGSTPASIEPVADPAAAEVPVNDLQQAAVEAPPDQTIGFLGCAASGGPPSWGLLLPLLFSLFPYLTKGRSRAMGPML